VVQLNTNETNAPLVMSVSNEATLATYDPNFRDYAPLPGSTTLTFQPSQFSQCSGQPCVLAIIQAPDILKQGPGGGYPDLTQPITLTVQIGNNEPATAQVALDPPPVMLVHGLWGTSSSLANVQSYLSQQASFASLPSYFMDAIQYTNDIAFDDSTVEQVVTNAIQNFTTSLTDDNIAFGRIDVVAHSMGGLVARHYSSTSGYVGSQNRQLGYFHSVAVIDTPEAGSLLATFLVNNATVGFSKHASSLAKLVKKKGCGTATTVSGCFATNGENLAPPGQPVTAGAVYSLEPTSPNIMALPPAAIPNAKQFVISANVSQDDNPLDDPNALVFELNWLISATCPGAPCCPTKSTPTPTVATILGDASNDAIVTILSQLSGCASSCSETHLTGLAHTAPPDAGYYSHWVLDYSNVLTSTEVSQFGFCFLENIECPLAKPPSVTSISDGQRFVRIQLARAAEDAELQPEVKRISIAPLGQLTMGTAFPLRVHYPVAKIKSVFVREFNGTDSGLTGFNVPVGALQDGQGVIRIVPLLKGKVKFIINVEYADGAYEVREFTAAVSLPHEPPKEFWADYMQRSMPGLRGRNGAVMGSDGILQPVVVFASAPDKVVFLRGLASFQVVPNDDAPVVEMHANGSFTPLRPGIARVEVHFGSFTTQVEIVVRPK
jgi:pimeloyl-ACP methyl ester carboxylesterase